MKTTQLNKTHLLFLPISLWYEYMVKMYVVVFFYLCNVSKWLFILNQHLGELKALLWTDPHYVP